VRSAEERLAMKRPGARIPAGRAPTPISQTRPKARETCFVGVREAALERGHVSGANNHAGGESTRVTPVE